MEFVVKMWSFIDFALIPKTLHNFGNHPQVLLHLYVQSFWSLSSSVWQSLQPNFGDCLLSFVFTDFSSLRVNIVESTQVVVSKHWHLHRV